MEKSSVSASVSSVRRVLLSCKDIKRLKLKKKTSLTTKHKVERLRFAERKNALEKETKKSTIFKWKRFNLDNPDGLKYYFHDIRKETMSAIRRQMGGGGVIVWAGIGYFGKTSIKFIVAKMNSVWYINLIKEQIDNHAERISGPD